ncbi:MAG: efflux transporter outer membrane subunit [Verrucomicrobiota bacterium]
MKYLLPLILLTGCAVGPDYRPPQTNAPAQWQTGTNSAPPLTAWWKTFHDPELDSLLDRAVKANRDLRLAHARVLEARAYRSGAISDFLPNINLNTSYLKTHRSKNGSTNPGQKRDTDKYEAGFDASWEIDVFGGKRRQLESASAVMAAIIESERDVLITVLAEVARNYVAVRGAQRRLVIATNNLRSQQTALEIAQSRFKAGLTGELDVTQAQALLTTTEAQLPTLHTAARQGMYRLAVLLGQHPGTLVDELSQATGIPAPPPEVPVGLPAELLRRRPDIRRSERELAAATAAIGVQVAELFPKLSLTGLGGFQSLTGGDLLTSPSRFWSVGPIVTWKLLEYPQIRAKVRAQTAQQEQALAVYEQTVLLAFEDVESALIAYANEQVRYRTLTAAAAANRRALELANDLYTKGLVDFLNVVTSENAAAQADDQLVASEAAVAQNLVALYKALGGGWDNFNETN